jgi:hypothetical protein
MLSGEKTFSPASPKQSRLPLSSLKLEVERAFQAGLGTSALEFLGRLPEEQRNILREAGVPPASREETMFTSAR